MVPASVRIPSPTFTREPPAPPDPPPSLIVPLTVVLTLLPPTVSALEPKK